MSAEPTTARSLGAGPLAPESAGSSAQQAPEPPSAGTEGLTGAASTLHAPAAPFSVTLPPTPEHPRRLKLTKDADLASWWWASVETADGHSLAYCSTWHRHPRITTETIGVILWLDHAQLYLAPEEVELLRPLTAHGLLIEEQPS